jgi:hypothetical protein
MPFEKSLGQPSYAFARRQKRPIKIDGGLRNALNKPW